MLHLDRPSREYPNPEFIQMARYITDDYWQQKLIMAAKGKFPRKISYRNGEIRFRKNNGMNTETLPSDPAIAAVAVIQFIRQYTGLSSDTDKQENSVHLTMTSDKYKPLSECTWKDLNKVSRISILNRYANEVTEAMNLTSLQRCQLIKTVQCGLICGRLSNNHIVMSYGRICEVTGLTYDGHTGLFDLDSRLAPFSPAKPADPKIVIDLEADYNKRRASSFKKGKTPTVGVIVENLVKYLSLKLAKAEPAAIIPNFVIVNDPEFDVAAASNEIEFHKLETDTENIPENWTTSPESFENSTSMSTSFECR